MTGSGLSVIGGCSLSRFLGDVIPVVLSIMTVFWLVIGVSLFVMNPTFLLEWNYDVAWFLIFGAPSLFVFYVSYRLNQRFSSQKIPEESLIIPKDVWETKPEDNGLKTSEIPRIESERRLVKEKIAVITPVDLENLRANEFVDDFFLRNTRLTQSKDLFKHILAYVRSFRRRALESENLELFVRLLGSKNMMSGHTYQDIEGFVEVELLKVYEEEREQRLGRGQNRRKGGFGGTERASTW